MDLLVSNVSLIEEIVKNDADGAMMFVFPELFVSGYFARKEVVFASALSSQDMASRLLAISSAYHVYIVTGYAEREKEEGKEEIFFISAMLVSPTEMLSNYRKIHRYDPFLKHEKQIYQGGNAAPNIVQIAGISFALFICFDIEVPELTRCLALQGCECFIIVTANCSKIVNEITVRSRAMENNAFALYVNRTGFDDIGKVTFCGSSVAYAPDGSILGEAGEAEEIICVQVDTTKAQYKDYIERNPLLLERHPQFYKSLVETLND